VFDHDELGIDPELDAEEFCKRCGEPIEDCECEDEEDEI
jgi:hypothetical protein